MGFPKRRQGSDGGEIDPGMLRVAMMATLIPMLMLAGPAVGYVLGLLVQNRWGGEPWGAVIGMLLGLVAGFRQVFLLLARFGKTDEKVDPDDE